MRSAVLLAIVTALLVGCNASSPSTQHGVSMTLAPTPLPEKISWTSLGGGAFTLTGATAWRTDLTIPRGASPILVNLTLTSGAASDLRGSLNGCSWNSNGTNIATGQTTGWGCPSMPSGTVPFTLAETTGQLEGQWSVVAAITRCDPSDYSCPPPPTR